METPQRSAGAKVKEGSIHVSHSAAAQLISELEYLSSNHSDVIEAEEENGFWVGLTDTETEEKWVWINNVTEVEQRYWMDGEPNNIGHLGEDCGVVIYSSTNPWKTRFDASCHQRERQWICEMASR